MFVQLTAVFQQVPHGFIAFIEELPGANTQGATIEEARANLQEAVALVLEAYGCELLREGGSHSIYVNRAKRKRLYSAPAS